MSRVGGGSFPISRDPPEGGTKSKLEQTLPVGSTTFPISRDPPEGGTEPYISVTATSSTCFQFLGIPPKGEHGDYAEQYFMVV